MNVRKYFSSINPKTIIYFAVLLAIYVPMAIIGQLNFSNFSYILLVATLIYVVLTKRWYFFAIGLSVFTVSFAVQYLASLFIQVAYRDGSFLMSSMLLAYFVVLFLSTLSSHAEWTVRSVWLATFYGVVVATVTETMLLLLAGVYNVYLLGIDGVIVMLLVSLAYLMVGRHVKVNRPHRYEDIDVEMVQARIKRLGFEAKKNKKQELIVYDKVNERASYRVFFTDEKIATRDTPKLFENYLVFKDHKPKQAYSWLLQESTKSSEVRGPKPIKKEQFIIVNILKKAPKENVSLVEIPLPRSQSTNTVALIQIKQSELDKIDKFLEKATVLLDSAE